MTVYRLRPVDPIKIWNFTDESLAESITDESLVEFTHCFELNEVVEGDDSVQIYSYSRKKDGLYGLFLSETHCGEIFGDNASFLGIAKTSDEAGNRLKSKLLEIAQIWADSTAVKGTIEDLTKA